MHRDGAAHIFPFCFQPRISFWLLLGRMLLRMVNQFFGVGMILLAAGFVAAQNTTPVARPVPDLRPALDARSTVSARPRASELGLKVGVLPAGPLDAITDVAGVEVGQTTIIRGDNIRTGVTAVLPHGGNLYREKVPGGIFVGNGFGKLAGTTQVDEMGDIETPILLTSTTSVPRVADALISYMLALPGNEDVLSINPVVGETNDGYLSDIRGRHIAPEDVFASVKNAKSGPVEEGAVGAGTGTVVFGWKGGVGTASRRLPGGLGGYTVGVLVQTNFGGVLTIGGAQVGQELGQYYLRKELQQAASGTDKKDKPDGSCMIVVATDAPLDARNLKRLAARAWLGVARTGSSGSNGSGDYAIAFSTAEQVRVHASDKALTRHVEVMTNDAMSPLFEAVIEATEEAIYNSMFKATTVTGNGHTVEALPIEKTMEILKEHRVIQ
jgi:D-aminopeptidase